MKYFNLFLFLFLSSTFYAQTNRYQEIIENCIGIIQEENHFFEVEGYAISSVKREISYSDSGFKKIKFLYSIPKTCVMEDAKDFPFAKLFVEEKNEKNKYSKIVYILRIDDENVQIVSLTTIKSRNIELEQIFVEALYYQTLPNTVFKSNEIDSIDFVGRNLVLGPICNWMSPHNMQCGSMGQMNWSIFQTEKEALEMTNAQYGLVESKWLGKIISQDSISIIFEGVETKALKVNYKLKVPSGFNGGTNQLQVFFVAVPVRNKFVSCVLSQYTTNFENSELAPLLSEVMEIK